MAGTMACRHTAKELLGLLVQVANGNTGCQDGKVRVLCGERCCCLGRKLIEFNRCNSRVNAGNDNFGDLSLQ
jgi:hypothetical protein